jgi:hypothetical protein
VFDASDASLARGGAPYSFDGCVVRAFGAKQYPPTAQMKNTVAARTPSPQKIRERLGRSSRIEEHPCSAEENGGLQPALLAGSSRFTDTESQIEPLPTED